MSSSNQSRYARASLVVTETFPKMLRGMISGQLNATPAVVLHGIINRDNDFLKKLNSDEKLMIQSLSTDGYSSIDFSLLYMLIKYYKLVEAPTRGWGCFPQSTECKAGDDIERLRRFRNKLMHRPRADVSVTDEQAFFAELINISRRIDAVSGQQMQPIESEIENFKTCPMDAEMQQKYIALLEKYLDVREQFTQKYGGHTIHLCYGRDIIQFFGERNTDSASVHGLEVRVFGCQDEEAIIRKLNAIKDDINRGDYNIVFENAESGTIVIYAKVTSVVFTSKTVFESVIGALIGRICNHEELDSNLPETFDICVTFEDYDYLLDQTMSLVACGPCDYDGTARTARKWCTSCEEGLCEDCEKVHKSHKGLRDHNLLSVEDYRIMAGVEIRQSCDQHGNKFDWYCKTHEKALCVDCVSSVHNTCTDIIPMKDACKNVTKSTALVDLEESICIAIENIKYCIEDREKAIDTIEEERQKIKGYIQDIKQKINKHLDDLEQKLLVELRTNLDECKSKSDTVLKRLNSNAKRVKRLETQLQQMKTFAADHQLFLVIRQINRAVVEEINSTKEALNDCINYKFEFKLDSSVRRFQKIITQLGKLTVKEEPATVSVREAKIEQAQMQVSNIRLQLKQKFNIKQKGASKPINGCTILLDNRILVADYNGTGKLMEYKYNGQYIRDIPVSYKPYDVTVIDSDRIAVSYGDSCYIEIINIKRNKVQKKIDFKSYCFGISHQDGKLYVSVYNEGIVVTDMTGNILHQIKCSGIIFHITTTKDKIFYTAMWDNTIHCCSMEGEEIWIFKDKSISRPRGISVDNNQNVYVLGEHSCNLTLIQRDGTVSKTLLTKDDELEGTTAVYYRKDANTLMIGHKPGSLALYSVT